MSYKDSIVVVNGKPTKDILLFALSTCAWCAKTKALFKKLGVKFSYVDVDLLEDEEQQEVRKFFEKNKTSASFPKIFIGKKMIEGFVENEILETLNG